MGQVVLELVTRFRNWTKFLIGTEHRHLHRYMLMLETCNGSLVDILKYASMHCFLFMQPFALVGALIMVIAISQMNAGKLSI